MSAPGVNGAPFKEGGVLSDRELWACALLVERRHADDAPRFVAERIGALALAGDAAGVAAWRSIAGRLDTLRDGGEGGRERCRPGTLRH